MFSFVVKRLAVAVPTLLLLIVISFLLMHAAPGGPFTQERALPPQVLANLEAKYGLDQPLWRQLVTYVWGIVAHFDFGPAGRFGLFAAVLRSFAIVNGSWCSPSTRNSKCK